MRRIGLAASKISKGNIWAYNLAVVLIASIFAIFVFLVCGFTIALAIFLLSLILQRFLPSVSGQTWIETLQTCLTILGILIGMLTLVAIIKNIKLRFKL